MPVQILSPEDVRRIHFARVDEFAQTANPIYPPGIKSEDLLASAVFRQSTSLAGISKYPDPYSNAASLTLGLCCDHPFHNGNKRTALVSLLVHLYHNRLTLEAVGENDLYNLVILVSTHAICNGARRSKHYTDRPSSDEEVISLASWIKERTRSIERGERQITYRQLRRILEHFKFRVDTHKGTTLDIFQQETTYSLLLRPQQVYIRKLSIPFPGDNAIVSIQDIKNVRRYLQLSADHGVDSVAFYAMGDPTDAFIIRYRGILQRLATK